MKFTTPVSVNVLSPSALTSPPEYLGAVQTLCKFLPSVAPQKWGWWEPLDKQFDVDNLSALIPQGGRCETVYWQRKKQSKAEGAFATRWESKSPKVKDTHASISFLTELGAHRQDDLVAYLKEASKTSGADLALIDALSDGYRNFAIESGSAQFGDCFRIVTHLLRHWLPDVFWGTVFGPAYVRLLGKEQLMSAPAYLVEELGPEMVYVQLSESILDVRDEENLIRIRRTKFKEHFPVNAFFVEGKGYDRLARGPIGDVFDTPNFELSLA